VLQVSDTLEVAFGGTAAVCAQLSNHLAAGGAEVALMTPLPANGHARWPLDPRVAVRYCRRRGPRSLGWRLGPLTDAPGIFKSLQPIDVAHIHGLWRMPYLQTARTARVCGIPVVVSAHGMLHAQALGRRSFAKRVARWLFQDALLLHGSGCLHATATEEAEAIRGAGYKGPIAIVPWGIESPPERQSPPPDAPLLVYLGRLHPSKGLDALLTAWARVEQRFPTWRLMLAGYDQDGYRLVLEQQARDLQIADRVTFAAPVHGAVREALFHAAAIVLLPSPAENFGLVVPEALSRGIPVIATTGAPWSALRDEQCGWWTAPGADALAATLIEALGTDAATRRQMGERGRRYVIPRFTWDGVARSMSDLYAWLAARRAQPAFVVN
jgi:glycosyltransferase involved in cell wall biosynthesis